MIPFGLLTNQTRDAQKPPRFVLLANAQILAQVVPVRLRPRQAAQETKKNHPAPERNFHGRNGWKTSPSPLVQLPMDSGRFTSPSRPLNPPASNGNGKGVLPVENPPAAAVESKPVIPPTVENRTNTTIQHGEKPVSSSAQIEKSGEMEPKKPVSTALPVRPAGIDRPKEPITSQKAIQPSLEDILSKNTNLPAQTVVLGVCEDGLPLALDLYDPTPGALLAMGDLRDEQIALLRTAVASACMRNSPRTMQFMVVSHQPDAWKEWVAQRGFERHCISIEPAQEATLRDSILLLADWTEQRRLGQRSGPPILLVIDTLTFLPRLDYDIRLNFDWLVKEGPPAQIWTFAAISTELASSLGSRMLRPFQSRVLGCAKDPQIYTRLAGLDQDQASSYNQPGKFSVQVGESWIHFQLPAA